MLPVPTLQISHIGEEEDVYKAEIVIHVLGSIRGGKTPSEPQSEAMSPTASCFGDDSVDILESASSSLIGSPLELSPRSPISAISSKRVSPRPHPYSLAPPSSSHGGSNSNTASFLIHNTHRSGPLSPPAQMDAEEARLAEEEKREKRREKDRIRKRIQREKQRREKQSSSTPPPSHPSTQTAQQSMHMMQQMQMQMQLHMHIGSAPASQVSSPPLLSPHSSGPSSSISSFASSASTGAGSDMGSIPSLSSFLAATQQQQHQQQQHHLGHQQMNGALPPFSLSFCN